MVPMEGLNPIGMVIGMRVPKELLSIVVVVVEGWLVEVIVLH